jgi:hypothetical protein
MESGEKQTGYGWQGKKIGALSGQAGAVPVEVHIRVVFFGVLPAYAVAEGGIGAFLDIGPICFQ